MKKMIEAFGKTMIFLVIVAIFFGIIYGGYWVVKTASYSFFYESMVEQTVRDMVKPEYLNKRRQHERR